MPHNGHWAPRQATNKTLKQSVFEFLGLTFHLLAITELRHVLYQVSGQLESCWVLESCDDIEGFETLSQIFNFSHCIPVLRSDDWVCLL